MKDVYQTDLIKTLIKNLKVFDGSQKRYLSYEELKTIDPEQALGIDLTRKEDHLYGNLELKVKLKSDIYLLDSEFVQVFGLDRRSFAAQPKWKQDSQKKAVGLF